MFVGMLLLSVAGEIRQKSFATAARRAEATILSLIRLVRFANTTQLFVCLHVVAR
jgi:hypothetical protein